MTQNSTRNSAQPGTEGLGPEGEPAPLWQRLQMRWSKASARSRARKKIARRQQILTVSSLLLGAAGILALAVLGGLNVVQWQKQAQAEESMQLVARAEQGARSRKAEEAKADREETIGRGRALFEGRTPLEGRMARHDSPLPQLATSCANCHGVGANGSALASGLVTTSSSRLAAELSLPSNSSGSLAPILNKATLDAQRTRRGGPPSRYDEKSLCQVLTNGIDPAMVIIDTSMPRYTITAAQCVELWTYLIAD